MPIFHAICNDCGETTPDLTWLPAGRLATAGGREGFIEPCGACGSENLRKSFDFGGATARLALGVIEPIETIDHLTGKKVVARSMSDLKTLADRQCIAEGKPIGTYTPHVRSESEQRERHHAIRDRLYEARKSSGLRTDTIRDS